MTSFFSIQLVIQCSINRDTYRHLYTQCSDSNFFISALAGHQFMSDSGFVYVTGVRLTQRKDRDKTHTVL